MVEVFSFPFFLFFFLWSAALVCSSEAVRAVPRVLQSVGSIPGPIADGLISSLRAAVEVSVCGVLKCTDA